MACHVPAVDSLALPPANTLSPVDFDVLSFLRQAPFLPFHALQAAWAEAYALYKTTMERTLAPFEPRLPDLPPTFSLRGDWMHPAQFQSDGMHPEMPGFEGPTVAFNRRFAMLAGSADMLNLVVVHELWHYYHTMTGQRDTRDNCEEESWASLRTLRLAIATGVTQDYVSGHSALCRLYWWLAFGNRELYDKFQRCYSHGVTALAALWEDENTILLRARNKPERYLLAMLRPFWSRVRRHA